MVVIIYIGQYRLGKAVLLYFTVRIYNICENEYKKVVFTVRVIIAVLSMSVCFRCAAGIYNGVCAEICRAVF